MLVFSIVMFVFGGCNLDYYVEPERFRPKFQVQPPERLKKTSLDLRPQKTFVFLVLAVSQPMVTPPKFHIIAPEVSHGWEITFLFGKVTFQVLC